MNRKQGLLLRKMLAWTLVSLCCFAGVCHAGEVSVQQEERGVKLETKNYSARFENGLLISFVNKFTDEEYCDKYANPEKILPHLPSGLGTQGLHNKELIDRAYDLFAWPWWEHPADARWVNQHYADAKSAFTFEKKGDAGCEISYTNLTDGTNRYADETFSVALEVDAATGDLLVTPKAKAKTPGVYGANFTCTALGNSITIEAPVMDGIRIGADMVHNLWNNQWPGWWQFGFIALNGWKTGSVGIWCQDKDMRMYKNFFYLINDEGLSFSLAGMNVPPFDELTEAAPITWRMQAFDKSWSQAVARFRTWREKEQNIPKHPEWTKNISLVGIEESANLEILEAQDKFFNNNDEYTSRILTWAYAVRKAGFDKNHSDNTPYDAFLDEMKEWNKRKRKIMVYLQPMLMWGGIGAALKDDDSIPERMREGITQQPIARTIFPFRDPMPKTKEESQKDKRGGRLDQTHLGHKRFRTWFFGWVDDYINKYGCNGIYYDQAYHCAIDGRGPIDGTTSPQGMADWFRLSLEKWPQGAFASELINECNLTGCSFGIAVSHYWGSNRSFRWYRMLHPSPVSAALCYPYAVRFDFGRQSNMNYWLQNLHEGRAQIPGAPIRWNLGRQFDGTGLHGLWHLQELKARIFVENGLRPVFPEDWDRSILSYYKGAKGEDFRYVKKPWGSALVKIENGKETVLFARSHGARYISKPAAQIPEWPMYITQSQYADRGPVGMDPDQYYLLEPTAKEEPFCFDVIGDQALLSLDRHITYGFAAAGLICTDLTPTTSIMSGSNAHIALKFKTNPAIFFQDGMEYKIEPWGTYAIPNKATTACALRDKPTPGVDNIAASLVARRLSHEGQTFWDTQMETDKVRALTAELHKKGQIKKNQILFDPIAPLSEIYLPIAIPEDVPEGSRLQVDYAVRNTQKASIDRFFRKIRMRLNNAPVQGDSLSYPAVKDPNTQYTIRATFPVKGGQILIPSFHDIRGRGHQLITCTLLTPAAATNSESPKK